MASRSAILSVKVLVDSAKAATGVDTAATRFDKLRGVVGRLTPAALAVGGALAVAGKKVVDSASRQQQAMGALDSVFGKNAGTVKKWADGAAQSVGLSKSEYSEFASVVGAQFKNLGVDAGKSTKNTNKLIGLGADLAATFGGSTSDAVSALSAALRGEADPAERYGLSLNQTRINAELAARGQDKLKGSALTAAKAQAVLDLATKQAGGAVGQFGRESNTLAGQQQRAAAAFEDTKAKLGQGLLPVVTKVTAVFGQLATWVGNNTTVVLALAGVLGTLAGGVLALNVALKAYRAVTTAVSAATKIWAAVQAAFNIVMNANPVMLVITAIGLLVAAVVLAWNRFEGFRNFVKGVGAAIARFFTAAWQAVRTGAAAVVGWLTARWRQFQAFWKGLGAAVRTVWNAAVKAVRQVAANAASWVTSKWRGYLNFWKNLGAVARAVWSKLWTAAKQLAANAVAAVVARVNTFRARFTAIVNAARALWSRVWSAIRQVAANVVSAVVARVSAFRARFAAIVNAAKAVWSRVFSGMRSVAARVMNAVLAPVRAVKSAFDAVVGAISNVIGWLGRIRWPKPPAWLSKVGGAIGGLFSRSAPAAATMSARSAMPMARSLRATATTAATTSASVPTLAKAATRMARASSGDVYNITVAGGMDSADAIARRIEQVLAARARRTGRPVAING